MDLSATHRPSIVPSLGRALAFVTVMTAAQASLAQGAREVYEPKGESAEAGFVDLSMGIDSMACDSWTSCTVHASGLFRGARVAVDVVIQCPGGAGKMAYRSVGADSDALLAAMAQLYKLPPGSARFAETATADVILLDADSKQMAGKVFFAANGPKDRYAELYTNVDKQRRVLEIHEKDPEYRQNVLRGLAR